MDFQLDKAHEMARSLFRDFAEKEVKPYAIDVDETEVFPRQTATNKQKTASWASRSRRNTAARAAIR